MSQLVKISDEMIADARAIAAMSQRSIADQIEYWAQLGRALEPVLRGDRTLALRRAGAERSLAEAVAAVDTPEGRQRVRDYLAQRPYPHYEAVEGQAGVNRKIDAAGAETIGRFAGRQFEPLAD